MKAKYAQLFGKIYLKTFTEEHLWKNIFPAFHTLLLEQIQQLSKGGNSPSIWTLAYQFFFRCALESIAILKNLHKPILQN
jgi:uncharacterized membrane protein